MPRVLAATLLSLLLAGVPAHAREPRIELARLAAGFEVNLGQVARPDVLYLWRSGSIAVATTAGGIELSIPGDRVAIRAVGSNPHPAIVGTEELPGAVHYLRGCDPDGWRTGVVRYGKVTYHDLYPGVDLLFHGDRYPLEFDLVVEPGHGVAALERIELELQGAATSCLEESGDLALAVQGGEIRLHRPLVEEVTPAGSRPLPSRFVMRGPNRIGFEVDGWDPDRRLVIDPVLEFSSYLGGGGEDAIVDMAIDAAGMIYVLGNTDSVDFPVVSPLQGGCPTCSRDLFVSKIDPRTSTLVYSTYLGGSGWDQVGGIAVDGAARVYVSGWTVSTDFPVVAALQATLRGPGDAFVARIDAAGSALDFSTYLGGSGFDQAYELALSPGGEPVLVGDTGSSDFPTVSPLQPAMNGSGDAFLARLLPDGSGIVYSTYLDAWDYSWYGHSVAVDSQGSAIVALRSDLDVVKVDAVGSRVVYETPLCQYCGGDYDWPGISVAVDGAGRAHVAWSDDGYPSQHVSMLDPLGDIVYEKSYDRWYLRAVAAGPSGDTWVAGGGNGGLVCGLPYAGSALVGHLDATGNVDSFATVLGEGSADAIELGSTGEVYVAGVTGSPDFPLVAPVQPAHGGGQNDGFVAVIDLAGVSPPSADFTASPRGGPPPLDVAFTSTSTCPTTTGFLWSFGDGATSTQPAPTHTYTGVGTYTVSLTTTNSAGSTTETKPDYVSVCDVTVDFAGSPREGAVPLAVTFTSQVAGPATAYSWDFGDGSYSGARNPTHVYTSEGTFDVRLQVSGGSCWANSYKAEYVTTFRPDFDATPRAGGKPLAVQFSDRSVGAVSSWLWDFGDGAFSDLRDPTHVYAAVGRYDVSLSVATASSAETVVRQDYILVTDQPLDDIVTGPGPDPGAPARILSFDALGGRHAATDIVAYGVSGYGANVGLGNVDGAGAPEILTGPGPGMVFGPQVRAFTPASTPVSKVNFFAYGTLRYGVQVVAAGVDGDPPDEILTGPGPGAVFGPHLRGWNYDGVGLSALPNLSAFTYGTLKYGLNVGRGNVSGDARNEILTAPGPGPTFAPDVRGFRYTTALSALPGLRFWAFSAFAYGARVDGGDVDGDGVDDVLVGAGAGPTNPAYGVGFLYDGISIQWLQGLSFYLYPGSYGAEIHGGDVDGDGLGELVVTNGPDPAVAATVQGYDYESQTTTRIPPDFAPYAWYYGVHAATGDLGF